MRSYITLTDSKKFYVGDIEVVESGPYDGMTFVRVNYNETGRKKLNDLLNAHFSMVEWITIIVNTNHEVVKIVAYSEEDAKEYDIPRNLFSRKMLNNLIKEVK